MSYLSRDEFKKMSSNRPSTGDRGPGVSFFKLEDGEEAVVRFAYKNPKTDIQVVPYHYEGDGDFKSRKISCIREPGASATTCPMCAAGYRTVNHCFLKLIHYTRADDGTIVATPKIWEKSEAFVEQSLDPIFDEYGDLEDVVCKIQRTGKGRDDTKYTCLPANPKIYNEAVYVKDFGGLDQVEPIGRFVSVMDKEQMLESVSGGATSTPAAASFTPRRPVY